MAENLSDMINMSEISDKFVNNFLNRIPPSFLKGLSIFLIILAALIVIYLIIIIIRAFTSIKFKYDISKIAKNVEEINNKMDSLIKSKEIKAKQKKEK